MTKTKKSAAKALLTVIGVIALMLLPIFILALILYTVFSPLMGERTVIEAIDSPDGAYCAEIIDSDEGALGGGTYIEVYKHNFLLELLGIKPRSERVYTGEYAEYRELEVRWKDGRTLVIGGEEYIID